MNKKIKIFLLMTFALLAVLLVSSCGDKSQYALYDETGYQVSVKYDANGGEFATDTTVIVDTYGIDS